MTAIAAVVQDGEVWMGGDSAAVGDDMQLTVRNEPKVFQVGEFLIGFSGSFRVGQLLRCCFVPPLSVGTKQDSFVWMVNNFVPAVKGLLSDAGIKDNEGDTPGVDFLVGFKGRLFRVCVDWQIEESANGMASAGCGGAYVLGSLWTSRMSGNGPSTRIKYALKAAEEFSAGVRRPFVIRKLDVAAQPQDGNADEAYRNLSAVVTDVQQSLGKISPISAIRKRRGWGEP